MGLLSHPPKPCSASPSLLSHYQTCLVLNLLMRVLCTVPNFAPLPPSPTSHAWRFKLLNDAVAPPSQPCTWEPPRQHTPGAQTA